MNLVVDFIEVLVAQSINQSINQSITYHSSDAFLIGLLVKLLNQSNQLLTDNQSIDQSVNQSINQSLLYKISVIEQ